MIIITQEKERQIQWEEKEMKTMGKKEKAMRENETGKTIAVYFDQRLGAAQPVCWLTFTFLPSYLPFCNILME